MMGLGRYRLCLLLFLFMVLCQIVDGEIKYDKDELLDFDIKEEDANNSNNGNEDEEAYDDMEDYSDTGEADFEDVAPSILPKASAAPANTPNGPFLFSLLDPNTLVENKEHIHDFDRGMQHALWYLKKSANRFMADNEVLSVVHPQHKSNISIFTAGKDVHNYVSLARYFWPDPSKPNGLPYKRVDGKINPEINSAPDYTTFRQLVKQVQYLSLAYFFFDDESYAEKATQRIHQWFLDPATRMNPHLHYASLVRGYSRGRPKGIIDFSPLPDILDSIAILQHSASWKPSMNADLRHWFSLYLNWLTTSPMGIEESQSLNNHGTYYDVQKIALHIFLNQTDAARKASSEVAAIRITSQLRADGEQYTETARPFSWFYSVYNLRGLFQLCHMARHVGVDLFSFTSTEQKNVRLAIDYLLPAAVDESKWHFNNTGGFSGSKYLVRLLDEAYVVYQDPNYLNVRSVIADQYAPRYNISRLLIPWSHLGDHSAEARQRFSPDANSAVSSLPTLLFLSYSSSWLFLSTVLFILLQFVYR